MSTIATVPVSPVSPAPVSPVPDETLSLLSLRQKLVRAEKDVADLTRRIKNRVNRLAPHLRVNRGENPCVACETHVPAGAGFSYTSPFSGAWRVVCCGECAQADWQEEFVAHDDVCREFNEEVRELGSVIFFLRWEIDEALLFCNRAEEIAELQRFHENGLLA